ncbi:amine-terminal sedlin [Gregarina niphandrodes]|uniref:Amine-terminal sedlin n=1 Tax=Gregarina niphandrodes TaxID=110365 RepID=A0A023B0E1_GRENI|nr:amine-terminal sedlin [Gregarina niphandrodes]EZG44798.1 amine-terminal sedlin [Gregarina niphandrodes]|eukprot:XP_011132657.1 amine-terminal sedlin [Gregarina niphandrodes]
MAIATARLKYIAFLNPQNQPLYSCHIHNGQLQRADEVDTLECDLAAYETLDLIELTLAKQAQKDAANECFLGSFSCCTPAFLMTFAYVSSTKLRIVGVFEQQEFNMTEVRKFFKCLAALYAHTVANPFYKGTTLDTPKFNKTMGKNVPLKKVTTPFCS